MKSSLVLRTMFVSQRTSEEQSARGSLVQSTDSLALDYVAFGSNRRAVADRILDGPPAETKKPRKKSGRFCWWTIKDSNLGPTGYEPVALTN